MIHYNLIPSEYEDLHPQIINIFGENFVFSLFKNSLVDFYSKVVIDNFYGKLSFSKYIDDESYDFTLEYIPNKRKVKLTWYKNGYKFILCKRQDEKQFTRYEIKLTF